MTNLNFDTAVSMRGSNYTVEGVQKLYVNDARVSNLPPYGGGGATTCCAMLPRRHAGLTVTVDWTMGKWTVPYAQRKHLPISEQMSCCASEQTLHQSVPVHRYDRTDTLQVFFLPDDKVKVWVSPYGLGHPDHPSGRAYPVDPEAAVSVHRSLPREKSP